MLPGDVYLEQRVQPARQVVRVTREPHRARRIVQDGLRGGVDDGHRGPRRGRPAADGGLARSARCDRHVRPFLANSRGWSSDGASAASEYPWPMMDVLSRVNPNPDRIPP